MTVIGPQTSTLASRPLAQSHQYFRYLWRSTAELRAQSPHQVQKPNSMPSASASATVPTSTIGTCAGCYRMGKARRPPLGHFSGKLLCKVVWGGHVTFLVVCWPGSLICQLTRCFLCLFCLSNLVCEGVDWPPPWDMQETHHTTKRREPIARQVHLVARPGQTQGVSFAYRAGLASWLEPDLSVDKPVGIEGAFPTSNQHQTHLQPPLLAKNTSSMSRSGHLKISGGHHRYFQVATLKLKVGTAGVAFIT